MKLYRATRNFRAISGNDNQSAVVFSGTAFIVHSEAMLPKPMGNLLPREIYEEIVPKNLLIKLDTFVKAKSL